MRRTGVDAIRRRQAEEARFREKGGELASEQLAQLTSQLNQFTEHLEKFTRQHSNDIRKNPAFRKQFQDMCAAIGVDPLASSKGFWSEKIGFGGFYFELGVQIVEVCLATAHANGGVMTLNELQQRLTRSRSKTRSEEISQDDIIKAIEKLNVLGSGFRLMPLGKGQYMVQSVPSELNQDHNKVLEAAQERSFVTAPKISALFNWDITRAEKILDYMVQEGFSWVDDQAPDHERQFWFPGLFIQDCL